MRLLAALAAVLLVACAADPAIAPRDCTPGTSSPCACAGASGVQTCTAEGRVGACVCPDGGAMADAGDAGAPLEDRPVALDATQAPDAGGGPDVVDAAPADVAPVCDAVLATDPANCGRCGNACPARPNAGVDCAAGACDIVCREGFRNCDGNAENGCEVDINGDRANCGACGRACAAGQRCDYDGRRGRCVPL